MTNPLTIEQKKEAIRQKCVEANPYGAWRQCDCDRCSTCMSKYNRRPLRLADLMWAADQLKPEANLAFSAKGSFLVWNVEECRYMPWAIWRADHDDLDWHAKHAPGTIDFLHSLLCE